MMHQSNNFSLDDAVTKGTSIKYEKVSMFWSHLLNSQELSQRNIPSFMMPKKILIVSLSGRVKLVSLKGFQFQHSLTIMMEIWYKKLPS